jgi:hypothetical protein
MRRRMHQRLHDQHRRLAAVLCGHYACIASNSTCLGRFRLQVMKAWRNETSPQRRTNSSKTDQSFLSGSA